MYIVATISKNSYTADKIEEIILAGATVLRYNFSHGTPQEMREKIGVARAVIEKLGKKGTVKVMADIPGAKIRLGKFTPGEYAVEKGALVIFRSAGASEDPAEYIPVDYPKIASYIAVGQCVTCGDGELGFEVTKVIDDDAFEAKALNARHVPAMKALNLGSNMDSIEHITPQAIDHLKGLTAIDPEWVLFSFVNSAAYLKKLKSLLGEFNPGLSPYIVSKIETEQGVARIDEILEETNAAMVARGDLGLTVPIERIGIYQKNIVKAAKKAGKGSIVSTQILDSLLHYHIPSRAEVLDLTNIVMDGADGIMLAKETGISATPGYSVAVAKKIIDFVENNRT